MESKEKDVELCWRTWTPLTERAFRLVRVYSEFARQDKRLSDLQPAARALAARDADKSRLDVVRAIEKLRSDLRRGPRLLCEQAPSAFDQARRFVPQEILESLEAKIDGRFVRQTCQALLKAAEQVRFYAGPPPEDPRPNTLVEFPDPLLDEKEIDALASRVAEIQKQQSEADETERKRFEKAEDERKAQAERQQRETLPIEAQAAAQTRAPTSTQRGQKKHKYTQFILDAWDGGEHNREVIKRKFTSQLPPSKRRTPTDEEQLFIQWWANAAKHRPEMWSPSK